MRQQSIHTTYTRSLIPAAYPAEHPSEIVALRTCVQGHTSMQRTGVWPSYCHVCHTEEMCLLEADGTGRVDLPGVPAHVR